MINIICETTNNIDIETLYSLLADIIVKGDNNDECSLSEM